MSRMGDSTSTYGNGASGDEDRRVLFQVVTQPPTARQRQVIDVFAQLEEKLQGPAVRGRTFRLPSWYLEPRIDDFKPDIGDSGTMVVISGQRLDQALEVRFGGVLAADPTISWGQIDVVVPTDAQTGPITVQLSTRETPLRSPRDFTVGAAVVTKSATTRAGRSRASS